MVNPRARLRAVTTGLVLGGLGGVLLGELGLPGVFPSPVSTLIVPGAFLAGACIGAVGREASILVADAVLLFVYVVIAFTPLMHAVTPAFIRNDPPARVDAAVPLSSGILETGALDGGGTDRLLSAVAYVEAAWAPRLITTRYSTRLGTGPTTSDAAQRTIIDLTRLNAPWSIVDHVASTRDEALGVAAFLHAAGARRVAVITSPMHTRRACAAFEQTGLVVTCIAAIEHAVNAGAPQSPSERLEAFRQCAYEFFAGVKYRAKGWAQ